MSAISVLRRMEKQHIANNGIPPSDKKKRERSNRKNINNEIKNMDPLLKKVGAIYENFKPQEEVNVVHSGKTVRRSKKNRRNRINGHMDKNKKIEPSRYKECPNKQDSLSALSMVAGCRVSLSDVHYEISERDETTHAPPALPPRTIPAFSASAPPRPPKISRSTKRSVNEDRVKRKGDKQPAEKKRKMGSTLASDGGSPQSPFVAFAAAAEHESTWDSAASGRHVFESMIHPVKVEKFFSELWEKKPLLVKRRLPHYNDGWFSTEEFDNILRRESLLFSVNLDIVSYKDQKRETHNPPGRAYAPVIWDYYSTGCSVRLLNPQTFSKNVWRNLSLMQDYFGCAMGTNVYLTPPGTQGFAPHFDDIEAFILQLEGRKRWRIYSPRNEKETLPRFSSPNFTEADLPEPILDVVLEEGDLLYFPRGFIHQGITDPTAHSLHITVSVCQRHTWGDLLQKLLPSALEVAMEEDIDFRRSLPRDFFSNLGVALCDTPASASVRKEYLRTIESLLAKIVCFAPVDLSVDQLGKSFIKRSLPPVLSKEEADRSVHWAGEHWSSRCRRVRGALELQLDSPVKLLRRHILRLVTDGEDGMVMVYHSMENTRVWEESGEQVFEVAATLAPAIEFLIEQYPGYVCVEDLPLELASDRMDIASLLYDKGLIMTGDLLEPVSGSETENSLCNDV